MLKLLLVGQEIQDNGEYVSCQSSCVSQLIQVSAVFEFSSSGFYLLTYFSGLIKFPMEVSVVVFPVYFRFKCFDCIVWK